MHVPVILHDLFIISIFALFTILLFQKLKLPAIGGFLVVGCLVGPHGLGVIDGIENVNTLAEVGVIVLLFIIGLEMSIRDLLRLRKAIFGCGTLQIVITSIATLGIALLLGENFPTGLFWGFLVALSSTAIVMRSFQERGMLNTPAGKLSLAILIMQDLACAVMLGLLPVLTGEQSKSGLELLFSGIIMIVFILAVLTIGWYLLPRFLYFIIRTRSRELFLISIFFVALTILWLSTYAGLTLAFGAFLAGLVLAESEYSHQAMAEIIPFRDIFASLFFISVGMILDSGYVLHHLTSIIGIALLVIVGKFILTSVSVYLMRYALSIAFMTGLALSQIGEFSFVLAKTGQAYGFLTGDQLQIFLAPAVFTMILTPFMVLGLPYAERLAAFIPSFCRMIPSAQAESTKSPLSELKDHVIIAGYGMNGQNIARVLRETSVPYVIVEINGETVRKKQTEGESITFGDVTYPEVLLYTGIEKARVLVIVISDPAATRRALSVAHSLNPRLTIIVRTRYLTEVEDLYKSGANVVIPEEFETGIEIFSRVLQAYKMPLNTIYKYVNAIRQEGYEKLREPNLSPSHTHHPDTILQFLNLITYQIEQGKGLIGETIGTMQFRSRTGATIIAIAHGDQLISNPGPNCELKKDDIIAMVGQEEALQKAIDLIEKESVDRWSFRE